MMKSRMNERSGFGARLSVGVFCLIGLSQSALKAAEQPERESAPPNVIMLMSDDQGWGDVGFNGNDDIHTPNLDAMAAGGARLDRFYAAAPLCSPTRGSCLTGRYPFRFGILAAHTGAMRVGETTIPELLKKKDYRTGFFGKWHIGWVKPDVVSSRGFYSPPSHHGFDQYFATTSAVPTWDPTVTPEGWSKWGNEAGEPWKGGFPYVQDGEEATENLAGDDSRIIMDRVIPFIESNADQPFLATVWFHAPHEPVVAGEEYKKRYSKFGRLRQNYYGCITAMDEQIGRLRAKLRELNLEKNTLVLFCSDNGPSDGLAKKGVASAGPFRGHKHTMYEGGVLVPACVEWPGVIPAGTTSDVRCSTVDFLPTIAQACGVESAIKSSLPIDGIDLMPVLTGADPDPDRDLFFGYRRLYQGTDGKAIISGDWKLLQEAKKSGRRYLFDLSKDPYEEHDLTDEFPERASTLSRKLAEIEASCQRSRDGADYRY
ncbi:sulfatase-like hydrolase/transferase [Allorhodopirellula solitaria]|uniref:Arylsulfatase n=1 Tax=Allorhodopirellula solitaria TaxID=2527987 RepID=A0A5C5X090_9BACT|nr:sulfatase-like hydrolase/transferase [Allorhodopirellula solitaria]TWT56564.1 Arylsulfatase precursor [Allorhodopirellula solitaria]